MRNDVKALQEKKAFICDMDGVIYHGNRIIPHVAEFVEWLLQNDKKFLFLTNSSEYEAFPYGSDGQRGPFLHQCSGNGLLFGLPVPRRLGVRDR